MNTINENTLWTRDFTIITVGSMVSKLGNALSGFAIGLLVLDISQSAFLYALFMFFYTAPKVIAPILAGPYLDQYSRKKTIYSLDFLSSGIYVLFAIGMICNVFNYWFLIIGCLILGTIDSIYSVAYDSFYPLLISKGNYTKAYSLSSTLEMLTMFMIPVSAFLYNTVGIVPLFVIDAASFLIAAIFETQIKHKEEYSENMSEKFSMKNYKQDMFEGIQYLRSEKGLLAITLYFMITMLAGGGYGAIVLPYFKGVYENGEYIYMIVMAGGGIGRILGGMIHYKYKYPVNKKFAIALFVYITISILEGSFLYFPIPVMFTLSFITGILGVTSYNIRISATQSYVPDSRKGRFNGIFQMATTVGMLLGQLIGGVLTVGIHERYVISGLMAVNLAAAIVIMFRAKKYVKPIYNRQS